MTGHNCMNYNVTRTSITYLGDQTRPCRITVTFVKRFWPFLFFMCRQWKSFSQEESRSRRAVTEKLVVSKTQVIWALNSNTNHSEEGAEGDCLMSHSGWAYRRRQSNILATVNPRPNQFLSSCHYSFISSSCSLKWIYTQICPQTKKTLILHSSRPPCDHSTWSGSASMQVSHGFLGIWGMERSRRAMPVRKRRMKPVQAQAKDQA